MSTVLAHSDAPQVATPRGLSVRSTLRAATHDDHQALEETAIMRALTSDRLARDRYAEILRVLLGWYLSAEPLIHDILANTGVPEVDERRKTPWLRNDLILLEGYWGRVETAPPLRLGSVEEALGALYVIEGSTLGGAVIVGDLRERLGDPGAPVRFFENYGTERGRMWRVFLDHLEVALAKPAALEAGITGALAAFRSLRSWVERRSASAC